MMPLGAFCIKLTSRVPVAQLDRVVAFEANGCGFESLPGRHLESKGLAPLASALLLVLSVLLFVAL